MYLNPTVRSAVGIYIDVLFSVVILFIGYNFEAVVVRQNQNRQNLVCIRTSHTHITRPQITGTHGIFPVHYTYQISWTALTFLSHYIRKLLTLFVVLKVTNRKNYLPMKFATRRNAKGHEYVVRLTSSPSLDGKSTASSKRKQWGKDKADQLEMRYASRIDRKAERAMNQREERRAKRKL
jgi:hypothetical protein